MAGLDDVMAMAKMAGGADIGGALELAAQLGNVLSSIERHLAFNSFAMSKMVGVVNQETNEFEPSPFYTAVLRVADTLDAKEDAELVDVKAG